MVLNMGWVNSKFGGRIQNVMPCLCHGLLKKCRPTVGQGSAAQGLARFANFTKKIKDFRLPYVRCRQPRGLVRFANFTKNNQRKISIFVKNSAKTSTLLHCLSVIYTGFFGYHMFGVGISGVQTKFDLKCEIISKNLQFIY